MTYLLDSDVFMQAKNLHYGMDFCPGFWDWLTSEHRAGQIFSVEAVHGELRDSQLAEWAKRQPPGFFLDVDETSKGAMSTVSAWVAGQARFTDGARAEFFAAADYYLVAQALGHGHTVVTHESPQPLSTTTVKIPDVCAGVGVPCITIFELLRRSGVRFVVE
jgi:hypothetical protein